MSTFILPPLEGDGVWPSLGPQVADWQEAMLAFGPGDLLGKPYRVDDEGRALLERAYQVYPPQHRGRCRFDIDGASWRCSVGNGKCGRRRFQTVVIMMRKGTLKSERLAGLGAVELADDGPVRCDGFQRVGGRWEPVGRPVISPFVFIFAFAKEQAEDTSFDAMRQMIQLGPGAERFDVWEERILRRDGTGEAKAMATAPDSKDGGKTTFQGKEEGHRWTLPRQVEADKTTRGNLSKRPLAEPWEAHATTAYAPGEGSIIETMHDAAKAMTKSQAKGSRLFFFYRWANESIRIYGEDGQLDPTRLREAIVDASGPHAVWSDIDDIMNRQFLDPGAKPTYSERVWLNRTRQLEEQAFDIDAWKANGGPTLACPPGYRIPKGAQVILSFDGSRGTVDPHRSPDHTGLVATEIATGYQQELGEWDPLDHPDRMIPRATVDQAVDDAFGYYDVWRLYMDPPGWESEYDVWVSRYGNERVVAWFTWRERKMAEACQSYALAIVAGEVRHGDQDEKLTAHIGHARKRMVNARDDQGNRMWTIQKEADGSQQKMDLAVCGVLGWEGRSDAIAAGVLMVAVREPFILTGKPL